MRLHIERALDNTNNIQRPPKYHATRMMYRKLLGFPGKKTFEGVRTVTAYDFVCSWYTIFFWRRFMCEIVCNEWEPEILIRSIYACAKRTWRHWLYCMTVMWSNFGSFIAKHFTVYLSVGHSRDECVVQRWTGCLDEGRRLKRCSGKTSGH